uniref:RNA-directed DNA polymerase n=1 Tax=Strongyloides venezuelensis TaxID=75913 RepID=A0A0K0FFE4_STRVS
MRLAVIGRTNSEHVIGDHVNPIIQTHKMDPFSGEKETFPSYLQKFNAYCRLSIIPDDQKLDTLILHLRGRAMDLLMANGNARNSFAEAVNFLERNFKGSTSPLAAHTKLDNITCLKPENFVTSAEEIGKLIDQIYVTDSEDIRLQKKLTRISLLLPLELRTTLEFMNVDVFETAIHRGYKMWMNYEQAKKNKTRENKLYKENRRFQGKCSNCNKEGHMAKNCRLLKNNDNVSRNNPPTAKSQFSGSCVELQESKNIHNLPIIKVFINDLAIPALLDSGSTISMISQSLANKLNLNIVKGNNFVRSFNGSYHKPNICLKDLTITIGTHSFTWKPLIMETTENEHMFNVLLGCDFFKDKNVKFCFFKGERRIIINGQSISCINNLDIHELPSLCIKSKRILHISIDKTKGNYEIISKMCETNTQIKDDLHDDDSSKKMDDSTSIELNVSENENSKLDLKSNNLPILCNMALYENKNSIYHDEISKRFPNLSCKHKFDVGPGILKIPDKVIIENVDIKKNIRFPSRTDKENETINSYIEQMVNADILEKGHVPYIHPLYCIPKPGATEELRVVADLRSINAQTVPYNFESELSREMFARLSQAKKISKLDMNNAYYQLSLSEKMYKYFGVQGPNGCYFFKRLPQGAKNSSMLFNATLENLLLPLKDNVLIYCDDIVIYSDENDNHFEIVMSILNKFSETSLRINISKCNFECSRITFLGFQLSPEGISPSEESLKRFKKRKKPINTKELRSLLLSCNYFRGNIHKFVDLSQPLMEICPIKGSKPVQNAEIIYYPDYSLPFYITSDACQYGIGAYLSQFHGNSEKILGYFSKKIDSTVKARNPTFTEAISLREAIYYFKPITRGHLTFLRTDHKNLVNIVNNGNNLRYETFIEAVESENYKICYINALNNPVADDLSRHGVVNTIIDENLLSKRILTKEIQLADDDIRSGLESKKYILENDLIMFEKEGEKLPVIPRDVIKDVLFIAHDQSGHYSYKKTLDTISNKCYSKSMKKIIHDYCRTYDKAVNYSKPNECIAIDICGKISPASNSYCYVLGIIDCFSRFVTLIPLKRYDYSSVSKVLFHQYFYIHGLPSQVYVDGGGNFKNKKLKKMMVEMEVNLTNTIPYYSKSNTIIERMFKQMQNCIAKYDDE